MTEPITAARHEAADIPKRDLRFDLESADLRSWHPEGLHVAHFFNALSIFFPEGESFFIDSVRHFADRVDTKELREAVKGFLGQEAMHSREHRRYNRALVKAGLPVEKLEKALVKRLDLARRFLSPQDQLAFTIALEHYTAIMAHTLLANDGVVDGADPRMSAVWRWHAIEETEHKAVAFDVYQAAVGDDVFAYLRRAWMMLLVTATFWAHVSLYHFRLVRADGAGSDARGGWRLFRFLWIHPGTMRQIVRPWLGYFSPRFHPWQHDNSELVATWRSAYEATGAAPA
jgi:hypothetical protein